MVKIADLPSMVVSIPRETCSGADCPDFSLTKVEIQTLDSNQMQVRVYTKRSGPNAPTVLKVTSRVDGNWRVISETPVRTDGSSTGVMTAISFYFPADASQLGFILSPGRGVAESDYENNVRTFDVQLADLSFEAPVFDAVAGAAAGQPNRPLRKLSLGRFQA